jgi:hypothetical protein
MSSFNIFSVYFLINSSNLNVSSHTVSVISV